MTVPTVEIASFRDEMYRYGIAITVLNASALLDHVHNHDVCVDALLMNPRPEWLEEMVGPILTDASNA
jgi:uridylate kinase